jgi:hypothetical protein
MEQEKRDRNLGDEWEGWSGEIIESEKEINEKVWLFLFFYITSILILNLIIFIIYYFISPRLIQINPLVDKIVFWIVIFVFSIIYVWTFLLILTILFKKDFIIVKTGKRLSIEFLLTFIYRIAALFKISKDRIGNSYIKINNDYIFISKLKKPITNLLVLLPRCLDRETREKVLNVISKYNCKVFTATGGSSARQVVKKEMPDAIIGVACERDLISGIADSPKNIPIIGIANKRPEGPCKNTTIDIDELEKAIKFFLNIK